MNVICSLLCRYAEFLPDQTLSINGGGVDFIRIGEALPRSLSLPLYYAAKVVAPSESLKVRGHQMQIKAFSPDGGVIAESTQTLEVSEKDLKPGQHITLNLLSRLVAFNVTAYGQHEFVFSVDGRELARNYLLILPEEGDAQ